MPKRKRQRINFDLIPGEDDDLIRQLNEVRSGPHGALTQHIKAALRAYAGRDTTTGIRKEVIAAVRAALSEDGMVDEEAVQRAILATMPEFRRVVDAALAAASVQASHEHDEVLDDKSEQLLDRLGASLILEGDDDE